jgi:putative ABC transport system permease protein
MLSMGGTTAIFSVVNGVLLRPLPFTNPNELVAVFESNPARGIDRFSASPPNFFDWREQNHVFSGMSAFVPNPVAMTGRGEPMRLKAVTATPDLFPVLGVSPMLGRTFAPEEGERGRDHVAVLSHALWQQRFGEDRKVIGQTIQLDSENYEIVGVMPGDFQFPISGADLWIPLSFGANVATQRGAHYLGVVARRKSDVTLAQANAELKRIHAGLAAAYPDKNKGWTAFADDYRGVLVGNVRPALLILLGSVVLVLLIACANLANLLLARSGAREREIAIRTAVGAAPWRLIRQLLTESLLLSSLGALAGLLLAYWAVAAILAHGPQDIPRIHSVHIDTRVLAFTGVVAIITGVIFGLMPALRGSRPDLTRSLKSGLQTVGDPGGKWLRSSLIACELAISLALLTGAGLLLRSFANLLSVDPGFSPSKLLTFNLNLPEAGYPDGDRTAAFSQALLERLKSLPGVHKVGLSSIQPFSGDDFSSSFDVKGVPAAPPGEEQSAQLRVVSRDYFSTMQIPVLRGRPFQDADHRGSPQVLLLSRSAERKFFPNGDALGKEMSFGARMGYDKLRGEVIGIVGDVHDFGLDLEPPPDAYLLADQSGISLFSVMIRTDGDPASLASAVQDQVHAIDKGLPVTNVSTMETVLVESLAERRFYMLLLAMFAITALLLAAVGVYGVMSFLVGRRTQEIGIRLALGGKHGQLMAMVLRQAAVIVSLGLGIGIVIALATSRVLAGLLFGVKPTDPLIFGVVVLMLGMVAMLAVYLPARRVLEVDPMVSLRYE